VYDLSAPHCVKIQVRLNQPPSKILLRVFGALRNFERFKDALIQWSEDHDGQKPNEHNLAALIQSLSQGVPKIHNGELPARLPNLERTPPRKLKERQLWGWSNPSPSVKTLRALTSDCLWVLSGQMNEIQKKASWIALSLFGLTFLLAPWTMKSFIYTNPPAVYSTETKYAPFWEPPKSTMGETSIDAKILLLEWAGIGIGYFAAFTLLKTK